jgi:D-alanyl-lipoteichoic acid acyltransferase DltB (MBOAT superfamily)
VLSYTFQIYFDFSGYSDMAIGLARMFGIVLPLNFNSPYQSVNIVEFWRRWHMTLSRFLRDYLYIPLGGNRRGKLRRYINLLLTMVIGGLWHGAAWTFVLWGAFHGACLALNHLWQELWKSRGWPWPLPSALTTWTARVFTFFLVMIGWVFFRSGNFHAAHNLLAAMFHLGAAPAAGAPALVKSNAWFWLIGLLGFVWLLPNAAQLLYEHQPYPAVAKAKLPTADWRRWQMSPGWACFTALLLAVAILSLSRSGEFLYYNF